MLFKYFVLLRIIFRNIKLRFKKSTRNITKSKLDILSGCIGSVKVDFKNKQLIHGKKIDEIVGLKSPKKN